MTNPARRRRAVSDEHKLQRRDEIMAAAKEVFARKGFHATTVADIAKRAGLAYGSVYWYFDSKAHELATYFVGQVVGSLNKVQPARSVVLDMVSEFIDAVGRLDDLIER